jgi:hypothetical protein
VAYVDSASKWLSIMEISPRSLTLPNLNYALTLPNLNCFLTLPNLNRSLASRWYRSTFYNLGSRTSPSVQSNFPRQSLQYRRQQTSWMILDIFKKYIGRVVSGIIQCVYWRDMGWTAEEFMFDSRHCKVFPSSTAFRRTLGPALPPIQWILSAVSSGVKRPERKGGHSPPSWAEAENTRIYTSTSKCVFMARCS